MANLAVDRLPLPEWRERIRNAVEATALRDVEVIQQVIRICWEHLVQRTR